MQKGGRLSKLEPKMKISSLSLVSNHSHISDITLKYQA